MIKPRNNLVVLKLIEQAERQVGQIKIPTNTDLYTEAEVLAVEPGNIAAAGTRVETHDLKVGQRVMVQFQRVTERGGGFIKHKTGVEYYHNDEKLCLINQDCIGAILAEPEDVPASAEPMIQVVR